MFYIYDENPNVGYVSPVNDAAGYSSRNVNSFQRLAYPGFDRGNQNLGNYDRIVDSHFKIMKSPQIVDDPSIENTKIVKEETRVTESTLRKETQNGRSLYSPNPNIRHNIMNQGVGNEQKDQPHKNINSGYEPKRTGPVQMKSRAIAEYAMPIRPRGQMNQQRITDKQKFVEMNVCKTQIPTQSQKVLRLNSDLQIGYSGYPVKNNYQRIQSSGVMDKTVHKASSFNERNARTMSRVLDDMSHTMGDKAYKTEYKKRDIPIESDEKYRKSKRNSALENMRTYIGKDKNMDKAHGSVIETAIVDNKVIPNDHTPYAVFYRTNPQTLDREDDFVIVSSTGSKDHGRKEKRLSVNFDNEIDLKKQKTKKNSNTVKLHRKMKNFYNYRNVKK
ncbi:hypothetical protein K1T71_012070 [Dendrolimus kikuchii]|uniref:Uncharacterized protein n=1 Tax=Dendrolimus kikuchii TaxID=765133 RepID=A0ACC1CKK5_9NEOP|nr:hypothetical protein K1T71_012070 [Dendrolimus kikuchii]